MGTLRVGEKPLYVSEQGQLFWDCAWLGLRWPSTTVRGRRRGKEAVSNFLATVAGSLRTLNIKTLLLIRAEECWPSGSDNLSTALYPCSALKSEMLNWWGQLYPEPQIVTFSDQGDRSPESVVRWPRNCPYCHSALRSLKNNAVKALPILYPLIT